MARQGDGRAHLPGLQGGAGPADAAPLYRCWQDHSRRRADQLRRAAGVSRRRETGGTWRGRRASSALGDPRAAEAAARHRPRLSQLQPSFGNALGRRIAAHPAVDTDRFWPDGHALRPRRAKHRAPSEGQHQDDRDAREPARHREHRDCRRARRGHDSRGRSRRRDGTGPGRARWPRRGAGNAGRCACSARRHRQVSFFQAGGRSPFPRLGAKETANRSSCVARARTT